MFSDTGGSEPDPAELELNRRILDLAVSLFDRFGGELHLAQAWELYGETTMRHSAFISATPAEVDGLLATERAVHAQAVVDLLDATGVRDKPWRVHLGKGPADEVVIAVAKNARVNVLVMGTVARTGMPGLLIGNTAEKILEEVTCSVVAIKPPGFESPFAQKSG